MAMMLPPSSRSTVRRRTRGRRSSRTDSTDSLALAGIGTFFPLCTLYAHSCFTSVCAPLLSAILFNTSSGMESGSVKPSAGGMEFEITESVLMQHEQAALDALMGFREKGIRIATEADVLRGAGFGLSIRVGDKIAPAGLYASDHDMFVFMVNNDKRIGFKGSISFSNIHRNGYYSHAVSGGQFNKSSINGVCSN